MYVRKSWSEDSTLDQEIIWQDQNFCWKETAESHVVSESGATRGMKAR
jgi:hypothetical protein